MSITWLVVDNVFEYWVSDNIICLPIMTLYSGNIATFPYHRFSPVSYTVCTKYIATTSYIQETPYVQSEIEVRLRNKISAQTDDPTLDASAALTCTNPTAGHLLARHCCCVNVELLDSFLAWIWQEVLSFLERLTDCCCINVASREHRLELWDRVEHGAETMKGSSIGEAEEETLLLLPLHGKHASQVSTSFHLNCQAYFCGNCKCFCLYGRKLATIWKIVGFLSFIYGWNIKIAT